MENATYIALSRQMVLRREMDIIAHNMANTETPAFKGEDMLFVEYLSRTDDGARLSFVQDFGLVRDLSEGPMTATGNNLDFAIHGNGYFVVDTPQGERYTRVGRFQIDAQDQLVTSQGHAVLDTGGAPIFAPAENGEIVVARDGTISVNGEPLGRIAVVQFEDEQAMRKLAGGLYTGDDPQPALDAEIVQGMVEDSNVEPVLELTRMITVLRSYQSAQRMMETEHERQRRGISTLVSSNS
ncbi:flagellar basal-body rod protein FlgF [Rhodospirillaceae bacterium SYSU D60014]|uniref:flagellar basal-body rod protein FlgF n=1 Tax=Virgifigura deserti TaxID=2268457 RepID=UPI000E6725DD